MALLDRQFNFLRVNQAYATACGRALQDFAGRNHFELFPSDARPIFEQVAASGQSFRAEARPFEFADAPERGVTFWDVALTPVLGGAGDVECLLLSLSDVTGHVRARNQLQESEAQYRALAEHLRTIIESERAHLARELHDELGQALTVLRLGLMRVTAEAPSDNGIRESLRAVVDQVDEVTHTVQQLTNWLKPTALDESGLIAAIEAEAAAWQLHGRIRCRVRGALPLECLDRTRETALFRIVQESLTNVVRHAEASLVVVSFRVCDGAAVVAIRDNGRGIDPQMITHRSALGLAGMRERAAIAGGTLDIRARRRGTTVTASVPLTTPPGPS